MSFSLFVSLLRVFCFRVLFCRCKKISRDRERDSDGRGWFGESGSGKDKSNFNVLQLLFSLHKLPLFFFWLLFWLVECMNFVFFFFRNFLFLVWTEMLMCILNLSVFVFWVEAIWFDFYRFLSSLMAVNGHILLIIDILQSSIIELLYTSLFNQSNLRGWLET